MLKPPIFIVSRDRVTCLSALVQWLEAAGQERIFIVDNGSTYEPLLDYLASSPHNIIRQENEGHTGIWYNGVLEQHAGDEFFVVTDPDVVPTGECPLDAIDYFKSILDKYEGRTKAGFGLKLDDIPDSYRFKQDVIKYESEYLRWYGPEAGLFFAPIDTTFALYRPHSSPDISFSCRTSAPYVARHLSWYIDSENPGDEEEYYIANANPRINSWNHLSLPFWLGGNR